MGFLPSGFWCIGTSFYGRRVITRPPAYRVPFRFERDPDGVRFRLVNIGQEVVFGVTFTLHGAGVMAVSAPALLAPEHGVEVLIAARDLAVDTILVIRWFRPNGVEYLWRVAF